MTIQNVINTVKDSPSSIFTREDVLRLLTTSDPTPPVEEPKREEKVYSEADLRRVFEAAVTLCKEVIENMSFGSDCVELDSAGFEISGNEIYLSSVDLDEQSLARQIICELEEGIEWDPEIAIDTYFDNK